MIKRLYRFYNMVASKDGEPFALCDKHRKIQKIPDNCILSKIADKTDWGCNICESED